MLLRCVGGSERYTVGPAPPGSGAVAGPSDGSSKPALHIRDRISRSRSSIPRSEASLPDSTSILQSQSVFSISPCLPTRAPVTSGRPTASQSKDHAHRRWPRPFGNAVRNPLRMCPGTPPPRAKQHCGRNACQVVLLITSPKATFLHTVPIFVVPHVSGDTAPHPLRPLPASSFRSASSPRPSRLRPSLRLVHGAHLSGTSPMRGELRCLVLCVDAFVKATIFRLRAVAHMCQVKLAGEATKPWGQRHTVIDRKERQKAGRCNTC